MIVDDAKASSGAKSETITQLAEEYDVGIGTIHRALIGSFAVSASV